MSQTTESPMKKISLEKVVLNMGVGKSGDVIETAKKALDQISGKKSCSICILILRFFSVFVNLYFCISLIIYLYC